MRKTLPNKTSRGHTLIIILGITVLALLMVVSVAGAASYAYITNSQSNTISVIDIDTNNVIDTISVGSGPLGVAVTPDGTKAYVANEHSNTVSVIDTATNDITSTINVGSSPIGIAINPLGTKLYVANFGENNIYVIDAVTNNIIDTVNVGSHPLGVAVNPDGTKVYIANSGDGTTSVIDTATNNVTSTLSVGSNPYEVAGSPDGTRMYVANLDSNTVSVIDTATDNIVATVNVGIWPYGVAVTPDGSKVYVTNFNDNNVSIIDSTTNTVIATVPVGNHPGGVEINQDGKKVYVANFGDNNVSVIDTETNNITATVNVGNGPRAFGKFICSVLTQLVLPVAKFSSNVTTGIAPISVQFTDGSLNATNVSWDFENNGLVDSRDRNPIHVFGVPGNYTVNLTANNENGTRSKLATIIVGKGPYAYITNSGSNTVSVIDTATNNITATVPVGSSPDGVAVNPDGTKVYVANTGSDDVSVIDTANNTVTTTVPVGIHPEGVAVNPDGTKVYVTNLDSANVSVINTTTNTVKVTTVSVGITPTGVVVTPDRSKVYVTNANSNNVSVINTTTDTVTATVDIGNYPMGVAINLAGTKAYVANANSNNISVIDTITNSVIDTVDVENYPVGVAVNPAGTKVYVGNKQSNTVSVIDTSNNTIIATVSVGTNPEGVAVTPDGKKVYVANLGNNNVSVINTANNTVTATVPVGSYPIAYGLFIGRQPGRPVLPIANFTTNVTSDYAPFSVQFNDSSENATSCYWDFGDGANSTQQNPTHVYSSAGNYTVNLTVSNENGTNSALATITVLYPLSYTIDKVISNGTAKGPEVNITAAGDVITYLINVTNNGKIDLNNVTNVTNPQLNLTRSNSSINDDEILNSGETWTYQANYTVTQADINNNGTEGDGFIKNTVTVDSDELTPKNYTVQVQLVRNPQYNIFKSVISPDEDGDCIVNSAGDKIPYRIVVKNDGNVDLTNVTVDDPMITLTGPAGDDNDPEVLNPGEKWVYKGIYTLTAHDIINGNGYINNTATVSCNGLPEKSSNVETPIEQKVDFSIYKSVIGIDEAGDYMINKPGDVISYQVAVKNNGDVKLTGISVSDSLVKLTGPSGDHTDPGVLNPKETWVYTGNYEVTEADIKSNGNGSGFIKNTATASCKELSNESSSIVLPIIQTPPIVVTPESNNSKVSPVANFSTNTTIGYAPLTVQFIDLSQRATSRSWDFNNDGTADSTDVSPVYTYVAPGTYTANLTASNVNDTDWETVTINVVQAVNSSGGSSNVSRHDSGDGYGEAHIIRSNSSDVSSSNDTGTVTKIENNPQNLGQNNGNTANAEQTPEQAQNTSTPAKENKENPGFETICGITALLVVFLYRRR